MNDSQTSIATTVDYIPLPDMDSEVDQTAMYKPLIYTNQSPFISDRLPWPSIIILLLGAFVVIYSAAIPNIQTNQRLFGILVAIIWSVIWAVLLWVLWKDNLRRMSWFLLLLSTTLLFIFFIVIIVLNI